MDNNWKEKGLTGYPSIDKPWLKWYDDDARNIPSCDDTNVYTYLKNQSQSRMSNVAINYFGQKYTYSSLFEKIDTIANAFTKLGVCKGDVVTLSMPNIPENVICFYALNKIGAIANLIDLRLKGQKLVDTINSTTSTLIVATDLFINELISVINDTSIQNVVIASPMNSLPPLVKLIFSLKNNKNKILKPNYMSWVEFEKSAHNFSGQLINKPSKKDPICILHTSGTTGIPKGVVLTNEVFLEMVAQIKICGLKYDVGDTFLNQVPPFLAYNIVSAVNNPLTMGLTVIMLPDYQPAKFADNIYKYKPNHVIAGPADWTNFLDNPKVMSRNYSFLKSLISGSDKINTEQKNRINKLLSDCGCSNSILEGYGMTEIAAAAVMNVPQHNINDSVGIPLPKVNMCIFDNERNCELNYGELGEICMSGPTVMTGYYNSLEDTESVLKKHDDGILWLHSGDLGYINEDGNIYLEGRLKRIIIRYDGIKVSPFNLEKTILQNKNIAACCVVGHFDKEHQMGQVPIAYIVLKEPSDNTIAEVDKLCKQELSEKYQPKEFVVINALPLTPNGKVDYRALEKEKQ